MCRTMQTIVDRERSDADTKARMDIALRLWERGEHDLDKIADTTEFLQVLHSPRMPRCQSPKRC